MKRFVLLLVLTALFRDPIACETARGRFAGTDFRVDCEPAGVRVAYPVEYYGTDFAGALESARRAVTGLEEFGPEVHHGLPAVRTRATPSP